MNFWKKLFKPKEFYKMENEQGRPAREEISTEKVKAELEKGKTITELAKEFNCSRGTIYNRLKEKD